MPKLIALTTLHGLLIVVSLSLFFSDPTLALPPAPPNDDPANAEPIGPAVPAVVYGTTVLADDSISVTTLPPLADDVDGPDVFYSFVPDTADTYRVQLLPWQHAPLRSSDRQFTIYIQDDAEVFLAGARAPGSARPVHFDVALAASETYRIGVDYNATTHDNFQFTLIVDTIPLDIPDDCGTAESLGVSLPYAALNEIDGSSADYLFTQGTGRCAVSGTTPTTAPGLDHVYTFRPTVAGDYAVELASSGFDGVLYVNTSCPPVFPAGCLGASNHSTSGTTGARHELVVVTLEADTDYYVYIDTGSATQYSGDYALIVDTGFAYEISEVEPNDTSGSAAPLGIPLNGGQLVGPTDEDWWAVNGETGARVYAWANNGGSSNSTLDTDLGFYAGDGNTLIEFDDEDADGADAPIEDLRYIYSTSAPVLAGVQLTSNGTHYLRVTDQNITGTVHRYRFHVGVEPATRSPMPECEPNDTLESADFSGKHYYAGVIDLQGDVDNYAFEATVGDRVFIAADGDPERDSTGSDPPSEDPRAFHAKLVVYDPEGDILIGDISDSNSVQSAPDYPAQGGFFVARSTGTHYVAVSAQSSVSQVGPEETYELAVFLDSAAPNLTEDVDPVLALTPDFVDNTIGVTATDNAPGDSGICSASLVASTNLQLADLSFTPGDPVVDFTVELIDGGESGFGKLLVADCAGNTACAVAKIDVYPPICDGFNFSNRNLTSMHPPIHVPDNQPAGPGIDSEITIAESGLVTDVNVTITIETIRPPDIDVFLRSPSNTEVELVTDRGSSLAFDITDATFDDDAEEIMPIMSDDAPYTGTWLPEDPLGLSQLNGEEALGVWTLNVRDDDDAARGGARLVRWTLDLDAGFNGPGTFAGTATDTQGFDSGIASIELTGATNVQLNLPPEFIPGDQVVEYTVTLIDPSANGSGTITVTDMSDNTCQSIISLNGLPDVSGACNSGEVTRDRTYGEEVQADVPGGVPGGVTSSITVEEAGLVGEVEVDLTIDTKDVGRLASTLSHERGFTSLINRVGMDERGSVGLTKDIIEITLDDDAPPEDDAHMEPASGAIEFLGLHQPDGRGEFIGDGITSDDRDNMLFRLAGPDSAGQWDLFVGDFRIQGAGSAQSVFRRWSMTIKSPCGAERFAGRATDFAPGTGICTIELAEGATNLEVNATFTPGDEIADYEVVLVDPSSEGSGTLEIIDCADNTATEPISLTAAEADDDPPLVSGSVNPATFEFEGSAADDGPTDTGIASVELAPYADNLQIISVTPDPPADSVDFVVGLVDPEANGRGYVRTTDGCGLRSYILVDIDAVAPVCTGSVGNTKRYLSGGELPDEIPDNDPYGPGVTSTITVSDTDIVEDVNVTFNITHPFDDDIDMTLTSSTVLVLMTDIGSTGNDFIDTTFDDEAPEPIPDSYSEAPFTGSYQPEGGPMLFALDGQTANRNYTLQVVDDAVYNIGTFDSWSLTIESPTFPERYDGRTEDSETHDSGICTIELLPGATNLALASGPFRPGDPIVRYSVELVCGSGGEGIGTVRVTDCAGNSCDAPITLTPSAVCCLEGGACVAAEPECCAELGGEALDPGLVCLGDGDENGIDDACEPPAAKRPNPWEFDEYGGSCDQDSDCWGPSETAAYCVPAPAADQPAPGTCYAPANRYVSIARNPEQVENTARRISLEDGGAGPWWVGSPTYNAVEDMYFASVSATSVYAGIDTGEWVDGDWPDVIHVKGCEIAPGQTYQVQAIENGSDESDEDYYSEALPLETAPRWGDIVSSCVFDHCLPPTGGFTEPSIDDVLAQVNAFTGVRNAPLTWMDVDPVYADGEPEGLWALIGDVLAVVNAFSGGTYPGWGPLGCTGPATPLVEEYSNSGCLRDGEEPCSEDDEFEFTVEPGTLRVLHRNATYNCCPDEIAISLIVDGSFLRLTEEEILTNPCFCICCYDVTATIVNLEPGAYTVVFCWYDYETEQEQCYEEDIVIP